MSNRPSPVFALTLCTTTLIGIALAMGSHPSTAQVQGSVPAFVRLQTATPGTPQAGHSNVSGTAIASQFVGGGAGLTGVNADLLDGIDSASFLQTVPNPLSLSGSPSGLPVIFGTNTSNGIASIGVRGDATGTGTQATGVFGSSLSTGGRGVYGMAASLTGASYGGYFESTSVSGYGVFGKSAGTYGVYGQSTLPSGTAYGGYFTSASAAGASVFGLNTSASTGFGGRFQVSGTASTAVGGDATSVSGLAIGGRFTTASTEGYGVSGYASAQTGATFGGHFMSLSSSGVGVEGIVLNTSGNTVGVFGKTTSQSGVAVHGEGTMGGEFIGDNFGVFASGARYGGRFESTATTSDTVTAENMAFSGSNSAVFALSHNASGNAIKARNEGGGPAGYFESWSSSGIAVSGWAPDPSGTTKGGFFQSESVSGRGVEGLARSSSGLNYGGRFQTDSTSGRGVYGVATSSTGTTYGVLGFASTGASGYAVYALGDLGATGVKSFRIDHPLDPENEYLLHYSTESPSPQNFYSGNVVTDARGYAWINLPDYFEAINTNIKYQLTVIDTADSADLVWAKVVKEVEGNRFRIRSNKAGIKVSWRIEADRNDPYVRLRQPKDVVKKSGLEAGTYQHPELYGKPAARGIGYEPETGAKGLGKRRGP